MRKFQDADRLLGNEISAIARDAPLGNKVLNGTEVTQHSVNEIQIGSGRILSENVSVDVTQTTETVDLPAAAGGDETNYRYVTVSRQPNGTVELTNGAVGTIDAEGEISNPVAGQPHPDGNIYLATVLADEDEIVDIYDGRANFNVSLLTTVPQQPQEPIVIPENEALTVPRRMDARDTRITDLDGLLRIQPYQ